MIEPEFLTKNIAEMRAAADILRRITVDDEDPWATMLTMVADATHAATSRPRSTAETLTWTPVVVHAARIAKRIIDTIDTMDNEPTRLPGPRASTPVDENSPADGVR